MPRRTYPRPSKQHEAMASKILARHSSVAGVSIALPIPIEQIVETTYQLEILWDDILEPPGSIILGALAPRDRRIVLNSRHQELFEEYMGPERFTLAHELAHWIYDADDPNQLFFDFGEEVEETFCYERGSARLSEESRIREINANKLAAHLLLPEELVLRANVQEVLGDLANAARNWGVSRKTLEIRLQELGVIPN